MSDADPETGEVWTPPPPPPPPNRSAEIAKLATALATAQGNFEAIPKDREVLVRSARGDYKFKYATLGAILSATVPALSEQGLALVQSMVHDRDGNPALETMLLHSSGEWIRNATPMFVSGRRTSDGRDLPPSNQELGSAQSYARRYGISALLCVTADEDDDGNIADGNSVERTPYKGKAAPPAVAAKGIARPASNWVEEAMSDGTLDTNRPKGTLPGKVDEATTNRIAWVDAAIDAFPGFTTKLQFTDWWDTEKARRAVIQKALPDHYARLSEAYASGMERVRGT